MKIQLLGQEEAKQLPEHQGDWLRIEAVHSGPNAGGPLSDTGPLGIAFSLMFSVLGKASPSLPASVFSLTNAN